MKNNTQVTVLKIKSNVKAGIWGVRKPENQTPPQPVAPAPTPTPGS